ncbi:MAG: glutaredoxin family protein [Thermosynechococcaceae cyanobacterium]
MQTLILYSKPGCHLCEGLQEKLAQIQAIAFDLEVRDITTRADWMQAYEYEVPVLVYRGADATEIPIPRPSPRLTVAQLERFLQAHLTE